MFKSIQQKLEYERGVFREALVKLQCYCPENDPEIKAKGVSVDFVQAKIAVLSREIDAYRVAQLCLDNMEPVTTPAGPASPVPAPLPEPEDEDG